MYESLRGRFNHFRKLWWMFLFFCNKNVLNQSIFLIVHCAVCLLHNGKKSPNLTKLKNLDYWKNAPVISIFCLIAKIQNNFLVPRMIESGRQTFMPIQTLDLHRVTQDEIRNGTEKLNSAAFSGRNFRRVLEEFP